MNENKTYKEYQNMMSVSPILEDGDSTNVVVYSFDLDTSKFTYDLKKNGEPLSLSNASDVSFVLYFGGDDPEKYPKANLVGTIEDKLTSRVSFIMPKQYLGFSGRVLGEVNVTYTNGQSMTVGYFYFVMQPSYINGGLKIEQQV
ncbi:BppU family phage baseplate upper protein, partial [Vagococcus vulneris]